MVVMHIYTCMYVSKLFLMSAKYAISSHVGKHERKYTYSKPQNTVAQKYKFALGFSYLKLI